jgi:hypothetical protein
MGASALSRSTLDSQCWLKNSSLTDEWVFKETSWKVVFKGSRTEMGSWTDSFLRMTNLSIELLDKKMPESGLWCVSLLKHYWESCRVDSPWELNVPERKAQAHPHVLKNSKLAGEGTSEFLRKRVKFLSQHWLLFLYIHILQFTKGEGEEGWPKQWTRRVQLPLQRTQLVQVRVSTFFFCFFARASGKI